MNIYQILKTPNFDLTEDTKKKIQEMNGSHINLVGRLNLKFQREICRRCLIIHEALLPSLILSLDDKIKLPIVIDTLAVKLVELEGYTSLIKLVKMGGGRYALGSNGEWKTFVSRNHPEVDVPIDLWSFVDGESTRCFLIDYLRS